MESQTLPPQPVILSSPKPTTIAQSPNTKRGFLGTLGLLFTGWVIGNLIAFSILGIAAISLVGSSGLVRIPLVSQWFFGTAENKPVVVDSFALEEAEAKLDQIDKLKAGETLEELALSEEEVNALLSNSIQNSNDFPINDPKLEIIKGGFIFTGVFRSTNAPVNIRGSINVAGLSAKVEIIEAKFGKIDMPIFLASNIIDSNLSKIGLALSGGEIPAKSVSLTNGLVSLEEVVNRAP